MELEGKVALVTGGGRGLGKGIALSLARLGAAVAVAGRTERKLVAASAEIDADAAVVAAGGRSLPMTGDVTSAQDCTSLVARTVDAFGGTGHPRQQRQ